MNRDIGEVLPRDLWKVEVSKNQDGTANVMVSATVVRGYRQWFSFDDLAMGSRFKLTSSKPY